MLIPTCSQRHDSYCWLWLQLQLMDDLEYPGHSTITTTGQDAHPLPHCSCTHITQLLLSIEVLPDLPQHCVWSMVCQIKHLLHSKAWMCTAVRDWPSFKVSAQSSPVVASGHLEAFHVTTSSAVQEKLCTIRLGHSAGACKHTCDLPKARASLFANSGPTRPPERAFMNTISGQSSRS